MRALRIAALTAAVTVVAAAGAGASRTAAASATQTAAVSPTLHFTANGNFDAAGNFLPGADGFTLADLASPSLASALPSGVRGLVYVGMCNGADAAFTSTIQPYIGNPRVFGFYLVDEPDPTGQWNPLCPPANLKAESDWIHTNDPGARTFIVMMNMSASSSPSYSPGYTPANSDIDLYGVDPYPCRTELGGCDFTMITKGAQAAEAAGIPQADIVPVFQSFGGGAWVDDNGGAYQLPTAAEAAESFATWASVVPAPVFDYAYSWGSQNGDTAMADSPSLQQAFAAHNAAGSFSGPSSGIYAVDAAGVLHPAGAPLLTSAVWPGFSVARGIAVNAGGSGGYTLDLFGALHPFGTQGAAYGGPYWPGFDIARGVALAQASGQSGGYVLDGWGALHPFNGAPAATGGPYWPGWDIARAVALCPSGPGGYVLDSWGGLHPFNGAPALATSAYWPGWNIARGLVLSPDCSGGYVLDGWGGLHPFGSAPAVSVSGYWPGWDIARGAVLLHGSATQGYVVDGWGGFHPFGGAPAVATPDYSAGQDVIKGVGAG